MKFPAANADAAYRLLDSQLPIRLTGPRGPFEDWEVAAPVLLARARTTLRSIFRLPPPEGTTDAEDLARSLVEGVITFAWLAADPDVHLGQWVKDLHLSRLRVHNLLTKELPGRRVGKERVYRSNLEPPAKAVLSPKSLAIAKAYEESSVETPSLFERALRADKRWLGEVPLLSNAPFAIQYASLFGQYSFTSHSSVQVAFRFSVREGDELVVGAVTEDPEDNGPYGIALMVYLLGLLVAGKSLGWPDAAKVTALFI